MRKSLFLAMIVSKGIMQAMAPCALATLEQHTQQYDKEVVGKINESHYFIIYKAQGIDESDENRPAFMTFMEYQPEKVTFYKPEQVTIIQQRSGSKKIKTSTGEIFIPSFRNDTPTQSLPTYNNAPIEVKYYRPLTKKARYS
jgi:hypothetical protein